MNIYCCVTLKTQVSYPFITPVEKSTSLRLLGAWSSHPEVWLWHLILCSSAFTFPERTTLCLSSCRWHLVAFNSLIIPPYLCGLFKCGDLKVYIECTPVVHISWLLGPSQYYDKVYEPRSERDRAWTPEILSMEDKHNYVELSLWVRFFSNRGLGVAGVLRLICASLIYWSVFSRHHHRCRLQWSFHHRADGDTSLLDDLTWEWSGRIGALMEKVAAMK